MPQQKTVSALTCRVWGVAKYRRPVRGCWRREEGHRWLRLVRAASSSSASGAAFRKRSGRFRWPLRTRAVRRHKRGPSATFICLGWWERAGRGETPRTPGELSRTDPASRKGKKKSVCARAPGYQLSWWRAGMSWWWCSHYLVHDCIVRTPRIDAPEDGAETVEFFWPVLLWLICDELECLQLNSHVMVSSAWIQSLNWYPVSHEHLQLFVATHSLYKCWPLLGVVLTPKNLTD